VKPENTPFEPDLDNASAGKRARQHLNIAGQAVSPGNGFFYSKPYLYVAQKVFLQLRCLDESHWKYYVILDTEFWMLDVFRISPPVHSWISSIKHPVSSRHTDSLVSSLNEEIKRFMQR
jgi:hypothetical protein